MDWLLTTNGHPQAGLFAKRPNLIGELGVTERTGESRSPLETWLEKGPYLMFVKIEKATHRTLNKL